MRNSRAAQCKCSNNIAAWLTIKIIFSHSCVFVCCARALIRHLLMLPRNYRGIQLVRQLISVVPCRPIYTTYILTNYAIRCGYPRPLCEPPSLNTLTPPIRLKHNALRCSQTSSSIDCVVRSLCFRFFHLISVIRNHLTAGRTNACKSRATSLQLLYTGSTMFFA